MIITLTPFPSIEYIYGVEKLVPNCVLPSNHVSLNILSKGIYSTQIMKVLQEEPILLSSCGGFAGRFIKHYLDKGKIKSDLVWTDYETPHQVKVTMMASNDYYILKSMDAHFTEKELQKLTVKLKEHIRKVSTLVISGYLPEQQDPAIYQSWVREAKAYNVKTIVSTGQKAVFNTFMEEKPYALLLTREQLKSMDMPYEDYEEMVKKLVPYLGGGLHYIGVYLKNKGALILSKNKYCQVQSPFQLVNQENTATSGAFLGALAIGINRKYEQEKIAKLCLGAAITADDNVNHKICTRKDIEYHMKKTKVRELLL